MNAPAHTQEKPELRDVLAAERTFLAWIRTGLALMGFGFVVARFGLFLKQLELIQHSELRTSYGLSLWFGTILIAVGVLVNVFSSWHHLRLVKELERGGTVPPRPSTQAVVIALFLALIGFAIAIYLVSTR
jgi:putative membrane protein